MKSFYVLAAVCISALMVSCGGNDEQKSPEKGRAPESEVAQQAPLQVDPLLYSLYFDANELVDNKSILCVLKWNKPGLKADGFKFKKGGGKFILDYDPKTSILELLPHKKILPLDDQRYLNPFLLDNAIIMAIKRSNKSKVILEPEFTKEGTIGWAVYVADDLISFDKTEVTSRVRIGTANPCPPGNMEE